MSIYPDYQLLTWGPYMVQPFFPEMVQPASIDVHLDRFFYRANTDTAAYTLDPSVSNDNCFGDLIEIPEDETFTLRPGDFILGSTFQKITLPNNVVARFEGKSSLGRIGLLTHITAGFIDPGFSGHITLELKNVTNFEIVLLPGMKIGQLCFEELPDEVNVPYGDPSLGSHYQDQRGPTLSRSHLNFTKINVYEES